MTDGPVALDSPFLVDVWKFKTSVDPAVDPGEGNVGYTPSVVVVSNLTNDGVDRSADLASIAADDFLLLQEIADARRYVSWDATGPPVDHGTYIELPVEQRNAGGSLRLNQVQQLAVAHDTPEPPAATPPPLASPEDLDAYIGPTTPVPAETKTLALALGSGAVRNYTRQRLDYVEDDVVALDSGGGCVLFLPELPVRGITYIVADGAAVDDMSYTANLAAGIVELRSGYGRWPVGRGVVLVTYDHGFATIPDDIRAVTLAVAARVIANPEALTREQIGTYGVGYSMDGAAGTAVNLTSAERSMLDRYAPRPRP